MTSSLFQLAYLGPGGLEMFIIILVMLLLFGSKDAPKMMRKMQDVISKIRNSANQFKQEIMYSDLDDELEDAEPYDPETIYGEDYDYDDEEIMQDEIDNDYEDADYEDDDDDSEEVVSGEKDHVA